MNNPLAYSGWKHTQCEVCGGPLPEPRSPRMTLCSPACKSKRRYALVKADPRQHKRKLTAKAERERQVLGRKCRWCGVEDDVAAFQNASECKRCAKARERKACAKCGGPWSRYGCPRCGTMVGLLPVILLDPDGNERTVYRSVDKRGNFTLGAPGFERRVLRPVDEDGQPLDPGVPYVLSLPRDEWASMPNPPRGDDLLRQLEHELARDPGNPQLQVSWRTAWERAGRPGRDPRRDPAPGDVVDVAANRYVVDVAANRYVKRPTWRDVRRYLVVKAQDGQVARRLLGAVQADGRVLKRSDEGVALRPPVWEDEILLSSWRQAVRSGVVVVRAPGGQESPRRERRNPPRKGRCASCRQRGALNAYGMCSRCASVCGRPGCTMPPTHPDPWGGAPVCKDCHEAMEKPGERRALLDRAAGAGDQGAFREYMGIDELREFNPAGDENLRRLERLAAQGDPQARAALERAQYRADPQVHLFDRVLREYLRDKGVIYVGPEASSVAHAVLSAISRARQSGFATDEVRLGGSSRKLLLVGVYGGVDASGSEDRRVHLRAWDRDRDGAVVPHAPAYHLIEPANVAERWARMQLSDLWDTLNRRQNPGDERLRALERAAAQGDPQAEAQLRGALARSGQVLDEATVREVMEKHRADLVQVKAVAWDDGSTWAVFGYWTSGQARDSAAKELASMRVSTWSSDLQAWQAPHKQLRVFGSFSAVGPRYRTESIALPHMLAVGISAPEGRDWHESIRQNPGDAWDALQRRLEAIQQRNAATVAKIPEHHSAGVRLRSTKRPIEVWVHRSSRPEAQGRYQITTFAIENGEPQPWGHRFAAPGATLRQAVQEVLRDHGDMEVIASNPDDQQEFFALGGADRRREAAAADAIRHLDHVAKFADAMKPDPREWAFVEPVIDTGSPDATCVCGHKIRYVYVVRRERDKKQINVGSVCIESTVPYLLQSGADGLALALQRALERQENLQKELAKKARAAVGDQQVQVLMADWQALQAFMKQQWGAHEQKARKDADYFHTYHWQRYMPDWLVEAHFGHFPKQQPKIMSSPGRTASSMRTKLESPWWHALMSPVGGMAPLPTDLKLRQRVRESLERAVAFEREQQRKEAAGELAGWEPKPDVARLKRAEYALSRF